MTLKLPNNHKIHQMAAKYSKWSYNICTKIFFIPKPSKIFPNWHLWYETIPSGNPAATWSGLPKEIILPETRSLLAMVTLLCL
jgi:hypothetical protein